MENTLFILTDLSWTLGYNELIHEKKWRYGNLISLCEHNISSDDVNLIMPLLQLPDCNSSKAHSRNGIMILQADISLQLTIACKLCHSLII